MVHEQEIKEIIDHGDPKEAIKMLETMISAEPEEAKWRFLRGKAYWRLGEKGKAISDYEHAAHLDPTSPAVHALEMARQVMDFFNPDIFNP